MRPRTVLLWAVIAVVLAVGRYTPLPVVIVGGVWLLGLVAWAAFGPRLSRAARRPWRWVLATVVLLYVVIITVGAAKPGSVFAGVDTVLRLLIPILMLGAILSFPGRRLPAPEWAELALDMLMFAGSGSLLVWYFLIGPVLVRGVHGAFVLPVIASPVLDLGMVTGYVLLLMRRVAVAFRRSAQLLIAASVLLIAPDLSIAFDTAHGRPVRAGMDLPPLAGVASMAGIVLLQVAAYLAVRGARNDDESRVAPPPRYLSYVPYAAIALGFGQLFVVAAASGLFPWVGLIAGSTMMVAGLMIRQLLSLIGHQRLATTDPLTGLTNRRGLLEELERSVDRASAGGGAAVLLFDLNGFKQINDELGHAAGDAALQAFAAALRRNVLGRETVGRLGGDEFAIVLDGVTTAGQAVIVAERVIADLIRPVDLRGTPRRLDTSIGIALANGDQGADELLNQADQAMYRSKTADRSTWTVYTAEPAVPVDELPDPDPVAHRDDASQDTTHPV